MDQAPDNDKAPGVDGRERRPDEAPPAWGTESSEARMARLAEKARLLPKTPGVYLMQDCKGVVLYIGKAARLRDRVGSYFQPTADLGRRKQGMLELIHDFDVLKVDSEWEALLAESRLIKDVRPKFNTLQKDDKTYPYLVVTTRDDFPGVFVTRDPAAHGRAKVLGPFTAPGALREAVDALQKVFKFRTCSLDIREDDPKRRFFRPCILHAIGRCTAPCAARITKDAYREDAARFVRFVESKRAAAIKEIREEMEAASAALAFERAAALRDQLRAIEKLGERAHVKDNWQPETEMLARLDPRKGVAALARALGVEQDPGCGVWRGSISRIWPGRTPSRPRCASWTGGRSRARTGGSRSGPRATTTTRRCARRSAGGTARPGRARSCTRTLC